MARPVLYRSRVPSPRRFACLLATLAACARADARPKETPPHPSRGTATTLAAGLIADAPVAADEPTRTRALEHIAKDAARDEVLEHDDDVAVFEPAPEVIQLDSFAEVRAEPRADAPLLGLIAIGERVEAWPAIRAKDCTHGWRPIAPHGFVCSKSSATKRKASTEMLPRLPRKALVPGTYGKVNGETAKIYETLADAVAGRNGRTPDASLTVRRQDRVSAGGRSFWRTRHGYVATTHVRELSSSRFSGTEIAVHDQLAQPLAWARFRGNDGTIPVRARPSANAKVIGKLPARKTTRVYATSADGEFVLTDRGGWIARDEVRIAKRAAAPEGIADDERWLDIDLEEQVLVAYVGARPVYATMISSGRRNHDTPTGIFRIERKVSERTMSSRVGDDDPYAVDRVPWTAYFVGSFALHAAYWHGSFGEQKSHGCVNLSPTDARMLYAWSAPAVAPGWTEVYGHADQPGSLVRIRSKDDPTPKLSGYAAEL